MKQINIFIYIYTYVHRYVHIHVRMYAFRHCTLKHPWFINRLFLGEAEFSELAPHPSRRLLFACRAGSEAGEVAGPARQSRETQHCWFRVPFGAPWPIQRECCKGAVEETLWLDPFGAARCHCSRPTWHQLLSFTCFLEMSLMFDGLRRGMLKT